MTNIKLKIIFIALSHFTNSFALFFYLWFIRLLKNLLQLTGHFLHFCRLINLIVCISTRSTLLHHFPDQVVALTVDKILLGFLLNKFHLAPILTLLFCVLLAFLIAHLKDYVDKEVIIYINSGTHIKVTSIEPQDIRKNERCVKQSPKSWVPNFLCVVMFTTNQSILMNLISKIIFK